MHWCDACNGEIDYLITQAWRQLRENACFVITYVGFLKLTQASVSCLGCFLFEIVQLRQ